MRISEVLRSGRPCFSFEFFPPKTDDGALTLFNTIEALRPLDPAFVSLTYGAGGSTRTRTVDLAKRIQSEIGLTVLSHITCAGSSRDELRAIFRDLRDAGVENVLALRGDAPKDGAPTGELRYATDLVGLLRDEFAFSIGGACYPEMHPEAPDEATDLAHLSEKVARGAEFLVSQLFFDNDRYFAFVERARAAGITVPIVPGIMPITDYRQIARFTAMCGATIPEKLRAALEDRIDEPEAVAELGVAYATLQCVDLLERGAPGIHFYTLNKSPATRAVVSAIAAAGRWGRTLATS
jgi:methylenetetrahydrofolate reductase (NADPH)